MTGARLLAVFAHPDDETYRAGGTLALLARRGVQVWVLCATRGEKGVPGLALERARRVRQAELECACRALGVEPPRFLDYRDGALHRVDDDEAIERVVRAVRKLRPQVMLTWPPDGLSGHPDHITVSRWTGEAFRRAADPAAYPQHGDEGLSPHAVAGLYHIVLPRGLAEVLGMAHLHTVPDEAVTVVVDVSAVWEAKMAAIRCHRTQMDGSPVLQAPPEKRRLFLSREYFQRAAARPDLLSGPPGNFFERLCEE
ncbi:MAG TPA: PIG-L family deacetylase [Thermoflexia bacterium]|jgi:LmbE family N-acetylglucosaminyl deacetylase|nr:PIG-L family deacetylase [Thermoflexia bacterium]